MLYYVIAAPAGSVEEPLVFGPFGLESQAIAFDLALESIGWRTETVDEEAPVNLTEAHPPVFVLARFLRHLPISVFPERVQVALDLLRVEVERA